MEHMDIENRIKLVQVEIESNTSYIRGNSNSSLLTEMNLYAYH